MANTTRTEIPVEQTEFYDKTLLVKAYPALVHGSYAQIRDIPRNFGTNVIKFRRYGLLSANTTALSEGVTPSGTSLSVTDVTATVAQYGDYVTLTDKVQFETADPILTETADILGQQAGNSLDQLMRDVAAAGTTIQYASTSTTTATVGPAMKLDRAEVKEAVKTLKGNDAMKITSMVNPSGDYNTVPVNACYVGIIHPNTTFDLKDAEGFIPVEKYANKSNLLPYEVGALDEVRFVESTNAKRVTGTLVTYVYKTLILAQNALGQTRISGESLRNIIKPLGSAGTADPLDQRSTSGWKATFVGKILNNNFLVVLEHAVTE